MSNNTKLFSIEGPEGSGKTLVSVLVTEKLKALNIPSVCSREPGGVEVAEDIRSIVVSKEMHKMTETLLFLAARVEHYYKVIRPLIDLGYIVILDRFIYSTLAIQGHARGIGTDAIMSLHDMVLPRDLKFITFYLDIDPAVGIARKSKQEGEVQKFELEPMEFHHTIKEFMDEQCDINPNKVIRIAAESGTPEEIADEIVKIILHLQTKEN